MIVVGFTIGIIAYVMLYLGKGIQKYAIEGLKVDKSIKSKHSGIWIFGLVLTTSYMLIQWLALLFAPINIIAPLGGIGLITLLLFSYFVLKEDILKIQILGVVLIIVGTVIVPLFNPNTREIQLEDFNFPLLLVIFLTIVLIDVIAILICKAKDYIAAGLILGVSAGIFNAFQTVSKRITALPDPFITLIFTLNTLLMSLLALLFTQFAFTKAKANIAVPCYTSASISLAVIVGMITLSEKIELIQVFGILIIIIGVIFMSFFTPEQAEPAKRSD